MIKMFLKLGKSSYCAEEQQPERVLRKFEE